MRLTVNLESDLYALARSLAKAEDCSLSAAVNRLLRRSLPGSSTRGQEVAPPKRRNRLRVSRGAVPVTADTVRAAEREDDVA